MTWRPRETGSDPTRSTKGLGSGLLSRRGVLLGGALAALPLGCSKSEAHPAARAKGAAEKPRELRVAFDGAGVSTIALDPQNSAYAPHNRVMRSMFDSLTRLNPDQSVSPWLAESWTVSPDHTTYEFKLRPGIKFHDGTRLDATALKANFDRIADPKNALGSRVHLGPYLGSDVIDELRLRLRLKEPFTPLLRNLSMTRFGIVSPTAVAQYGKTFNANPVATGPFRFVKLEPGRAVHLERNPDYQWAHGAAGHNGPAYVERLVFLNVPEESIAHRGADERRGSGCGPDPRTELARISRSLRVQLAREGAPEHELLAQPERLA